MAGLKRKIVSGIDRLPAIKYDEDKLIRWIVDQRKSMMDDRQVWSARRRRFLSKWDDYLTPARSGEWEGGSNLHLPMTMQMGKGLHARIKSAVFAVRPWWILLPIEKLDRERIKIIDTVMRWACQNYVNYGKGIELAVDDWAWDVVFEGWGVLKRRWEIIERKIIDYEEVQQPIVQINPEQQQMAMESMNTIANEFNQSNAQLEAPPSEIVAREVEKLITYFDGPIWETLPHEDILFPGKLVDPSDLNLAPMVCHDFDIDESTLNAHLESGYYDSKAVKKVLEKSFVSPGEQSDDATKNAYQQLQDRYHGVKTVDAKAGVKKARETEVYLSYDIDNDGINEELVVAFDLKAEVITRLTYLDRITKTGKRPLHKADLIRRPRRSYSMGIVELLYPLQQELDSIHNMRIDFGVIQNIPWFFYRPGSGMKPEKIKLEPGIGYPLENPQSDVHFPKVNGNTFWGSQEEGNIVAWAEKLTSITAMNSGMPSERVGASRTASGMISLLNEANLNIDVLLTRFKDSYSGALKGLLADLQERMPNDLKVRVVGFDNKPERDGSGNILVVEPTRADIAGRLDFILMANANNSNRELEKQNAILMSQMLLNPIMLQTGIVSPLNIYNISKNVLEKYGTLGIDDFITEPKNVQPALSLRDEIAKITQGEMPTIVVNDDHNAKADALEMFAQEPAFQQGVATGINSPDAPSKLAAAIKAHRMMAQMISAQAQQSNVTGMQISPSLGARAAGQVGETGRPLTQENLPAGQEAAGTQAREENRGA